MAKDGPEPGRKAESTDSAHDALRLPDRIGDFRIVRRLGAGGMGIVYEAEQQSPKRPVALKVIRGGAYVDEHQVKLFRREAQTLARLKHPSIAAIYEMGRTDEGQHFFAMELVRGETLDVWLKHHAEIDLRVRLAIFRKLCEAVAYAHQRGAIHRDLKPSNVLILKESPTPASSPDAGIPDLKILDFGLARITDHDMTVSTFVSDAGTVRGTLPYMSPEQVLGNPDEIDLRTDVYSLGVMLYELLTGRLPYDVQRKSLPEAVRIITEEPPAPLTKSWSGTQKLDQDVATIANKALEKEPARRYQSVAALTEDVQRYLSDQPILARPPSALYQIKKFVARHRYVAGVVVGAFVLLAAFAVTMAVQANRIAHERDRANAERDRANQEASTAKQVSDFLVNLFQVSDPSEARGNTITAREILDKGADRIERELQDRPLVRGRMMETIGQVYRGLGLYDDAARLLEQAIAEKRRELGAVHADVGRALDALALVYVWRGQGGKAIPVFEEALRVLELTVGREHPDYAWAECNSTAATADVDLGAARASLEHSLQVFESDPEANWRGIAWCARALASNLIMQGDYPRAVRHAERALELEELHAAPDSPALADALNALGWSLAHVGEFGRGRALIERAIAIQERVLGPNHLYLAFSLHSLGELLRRSGSLVEAEASLKRALAIHRHLGSSYAIERGIVLTSLGDVYAETNRLAAAEAAYGEALDAFPSTLSSKQVTHCLEGYAAVLRRLGREEEAAAALARARRS